MAVTLRFHSRVSHAAQPLHHLYTRLPGQRIHSIHHGDQRFAPRGQADNFISLDGLLEVVSRGRPDIAQDLFIILNTIDNDGLFDVVDPLQLRLDLRISASRRTDINADDLLYQQAELSSICRSSACRSHSGRPR